MIRSGRTISIGVYDARRRREILQPLIPKGTYLPYAFEDRFFSPGNEETEFGLNIFSGEGTEIRPDLVSPIGTLFIGPIEHQQPAPFRISIELDIHGFLAATVTDEVTNKVYNARFDFQCREEARSVFISYSTKDKDFCKRLYLKLHDANIRVWFAPEDIKGGEKLYDQIERAIQLHDKLLIVLSENSLQSEWVMTEIRKAREVEREWRGRKLFPIRLTDFETIRKWRCFDADSGKDLAVEVREYFIPDFSDWKDHDSFEAAFDRLLKDLRSAEAAQGEH